MKRVLAGVGTAAAAAMVMLGCSQTESDTTAQPAFHPPALTDAGQAQTSDALAPTGQPTTPSSSMTPVPPPLVTPDRLRTLLLPPDVAGPIVGSPLGFAKRFDQPAPPLDLGEHAQCAVLFGPGMTAYGTEWTAYKGTQQKNREDDADTVVGQGIGSYPSPQAARTAFTAAFAPALTDCDNVTVHNPRDTDPKVSWQFHVTTVNDERAQWNRVQLVDGKPVDWSCAYQASLKSNVWLYTSVCRRGEGGASAATQLAEQLMLWFPTA